MTFERITAADVHVGDLVTRSRAADPLRVVDVQQNPKSVWLTLERLRNGSWFFKGDTYRERPGYNVKMWRVVD